MIFRNFFTLEIHAPRGLLSENATKSTKPEVHNVSQTHELLPPTAVDHTTPHQSSSSTNRRAQTDPRDVLLHPNHPSRWDVECDQQATVVVQLLTTRPLLPSAVNDIDRRRSLCLRHSLGLHVHGGEISQSAAFVGKFTKGIMYIFLFGDTRISL